MYKYVKLLRLKKYTTLYDLIYKNICVRIYFDEMWAFRLDSYIKFVM